MATKLFDLFAELSIDTSKFDESLNQSIALSKKMQEALEHVGGDGNQFKEPAKQVSILKQQISSIAPSLKQAFSFSLGQTIANGLSQGLSAVKELASESISLASNLEEVQNVVDVTFEDSAGQIDRWAKSAKSAFGMGELAAKRYSGTMGAMLKSMGMSASKVADMSMSIVSLSGDMASFYNLDHDMAFEKIRAGIAGETEPLKQLGINMSVANMEAFAMSKGITKAYDAMSQSEQALLRYQYLMSVTADAQGDFARTSDGYANQVRLLEENISSLKTTVGEALLPIVTDVVAGINSLFGGEANDNSAASQLGEITKSYTDAIYNIDRTGAKVSGLAEVLDSLGEETARTEQDQRVWQATLEEIVGLVPELSSIIDVQTGTIEGGTQALRDNTQAWIDNQKAQAGETAKKKRLNMYESTKQALAEGQVREDIEYQDWMLTDSILKQEAQKFFDLAGAFGDNAATMTNDEIQRRIDTIIKTNGRSAMGTGEYASSGGLSDEARAQYESFLHWYSEWESANAALNNTRQSNADLASSISYMEPAMEKFGYSQTAIADATETATVNMEAYSNAIADGVQAIDNYSQAVSDLQKYEANAEASTRSMVDSLLDGFSKVEQIDTKDGPTLSGLSDNLDSQLQYIDDYTEALETAKGILGEEGGSLLASLSDGSQESLAILRAINENDGTYANEYLEKYNELEAKKAEFTGELTGMQLAADETYQAMVDSVNQFAEDINESEKFRTEMQANMDAMQSAIDAGANGISAKVSALIADIERLNYIELKPINVGSLFNADPTYTPPAETHARGLDYVPYTGYEAVLGEGEAILTRLEAEQWRENGLGGNLVIDYERLASAVSVAISGISVEMDGQTVGELVAPTVNRAIGQEARAGRYGA